MDRKSFVLYTASKDIIDELSIEQTGVLFKSILEYVTDGELLEMDGMTKIVFKTISAYLEKDYKSYQTICETRRINGAKGGRPKGTKNKPKETEKNQKVFSKTEKNIEYDYEYEYEYEYELNNIAQEKPKQKENKFIPPTLEEIKEYIKSKNYNVDPKTFYEYYNANSWKDKDGKSVKSWKQKIITWNGRNKQTTLSNKPKQGFKGREYDFEELEKTLLSN